MLTIYFKKSKSTVSFFFFFRWLQDNYRSKVCLQEPGAAAESRREARGAVRMCTESKTDQLNDEGGGKPVEVAETLSF